MLHLQRRLVAERAKQGEKKAAVSPHDLVRPHLRDRADTVLNAARQQYPQLYTRIVEELAGLVRRGELKEISGPWLCSVFAHLGYPLRLKTQIRVVSDGKAISMAEKLKG